MNLTEEQKRVIEYAKTAEDGELLLIDSVAGSGKEQPVSCVVKTIHGDKKLGDLVVGDMIFGADGSLTKVTAIYPQGKKPVYEFTFRDNTTTRAGLNHNWLTSRNNGKFVVRTTEELLKDGLTKPSGDMKFKVPLTAPVDYQEKNLPVDPYLLGLFLGDGTYTQSTPAYSFHESDKELYRYIKETLENFYGVKQTSTPRSTSDNGMQVTLTGTQDLLGMFKNNKHIPHDYLLSSVSQRLALLRGLMDSDGSIKNNRVTFSNTNSELVGAVVSIVQSLGGVAVVNKADTRNEVPCSRINVILHVNPFKLGRKANEWKSSTKNPPSRYIKSIKLLDEVEEQLCITVDNEDHLYLTDNYIVTHNTTLLRAIADSVVGNVGLYLAYNKAIATDSKRKFPSTIDCRTTHSLAYRATVNSMGLKVGFFGPKQIEEPLSYTDKYLLAEDIKEFCLSRYLSYDEYAEEAGRVNNTLANKYLNLMTQGKIDCTHDFYLKMFHIALEEDQVICPKYGVVMLDEAGDLNEVTLEIFKLLPAKLKIAVGDPYQNIYTFNHTINCFERLEGEGTTFKLSKSFRVPKHIATPIEGFCKAYLDPEMRFEGTESSTTDVVSRAYIARTNGGLINKMIELNRDNVPYGLVRKAQEIFKIPLMMAGLKYQGKIYDPAYKHLQEDVDNWYENHKGVKSSYPSLMGYIKSKYSEDLSLIQALNLISKHGKGGIFEAYAEAKDHENKKQSFMVLTAHSSKGLEFDEVILAPDMNTSIEELLVNLQDATSSGEHYALTSKEKESLNLYYVACTRAIVRLRNAVHLIGS